MPSTPEPSLRIVRILKSRPHASIDSILVTPVGEGLFRLEESGLFILDDFDEGVSELHSIIRCRELSDGSLEFIEVVQPSPWKLHFRGLPRGVAESPELARWLETIQARGWHWERLFVGMLLVHAAPDTDVDVQAELDAVCRSVAGA